MKKVLIPLLLLPYILYPEIEASYPDWRIENFPGPEASNDAISGQEADPDNDNLPNVYEYASGTDPKQSNSLDVRLSPLADWIKGDFEQLAMNMPGNAYASQAQIVVSASNSLGLNDTWSEISGTQNTTVIIADGSVRRQILLPEQTLDLQGTVAKFLQAKISLKELSYVWTEAEDNTGVSSSYSESHEVLSNSRWIRLRDAPDRYIEWDNIDIPSDGEYSLYVRKFWKHGPFHWTIDGSNDPSLSGQITKDVSLLDSAELSTHNHANWVYLDRVNLSEGNHSFRIDQDVDTGAAAYDCILFIKGDFTARGKLKPEESYTFTPEEGWFDFQPVTDEFNPTPLDLRYLNEDYAGSRGWISTSGSNFIYPDNGEQLRFWGINVGPGHYTLPHDKMDALARLYAKRGINHVRLHGALYNRSGTDMGGIKPELLDGVQYLIKAFKEQGIYTTLSIYFPLWVDIHPDDNRFPGYNNKHPYSLLFFNENFQAIYRIWWDTILTTVNPYTGIALKDDPALFSCELINEDSTLFWTFSNANIPDPQMQTLEKLFGDWCIEKYGTLQATLDTWNQNHPRDDLASGRLGFVGLWDMANGADTRRDKDSAGFLTEIMRNFYDSNRDYLRNTLGYKGLVQGTNWKTASAEVLDPLEKWANAGMDYLDNHGYYASAHYGDASSYAVRVNTAYQDRAAVRFDDAKNRSLKNFSNPIMASNYAGKPTMISEINWPEPNAWRADTIPFLAAYGALQGIDAITLFTTTAVGWDTDADGKFLMQTPVTMVQWPAAALMFRKGLVQTGSPAVSINLNIEDLWNLQGTPLPQPQNLDALRDPGIGSGDTDAGSLSFLVGPVNVNFVESPEQSGMSDNTSGYVDLAKSRVSSNTGEISLDFDKGILSVNASHIQGVSGFLNQVEEHQSDSVTISSNMPYGSIHLVSLDDQPIDLSNAILVQVASEDHLNEFSTRPTNANDITIHENVGELSHGKVITDIGHAPMMVKAFDGTIQLVREDAESLSVFACDENGNLIERIGSANNFSLMEDVFYYFIHNPQSRH